MESEQAISSNPGREEYLHGALSAFEEALSLTNGDDLPGTYGVILHDIAMVHVASSVPEKAVTFYRESIEYKAKADNLADLLVTTTALTSLLIDLDSMAEALTLLDEAAGKLEAADATEIEKDEHALRSHDLGRMYEKIARSGRSTAYEAALRCYERTADLLDEAVDPTSFATVHRDIGDVHKATNNLPQAAKSYAQAVKLLRLANDPRYLASTLITLGRVQRQLAQQESKAKAASLETPDGDGF